jgi:hypothetical protein
MTMTTFKSTMLGGTVAVVLVLGVSVAAGATKLNRAERDGYLEWLHSLEQTVAGRQLAQQPEARLLFPLDTPSWQRAEPVTPYRHLAIGKAVAELEEFWAEHGSGPAPLVALANARNYMNLSEYDSALVWYEITARADTAGRFTREVAREALAAAVAVGDSLDAVRRVTDTLGAADLAARADEAALAYRWLLVNRDTRAIDLMIGKVAGLDSLTPPRLRYWHARALAWRERRAESLTELRMLVSEAQGMSLGLGEQERAWVLAAMPDLMYLLGDADGARELYRRLAVSTLGRVALWGRYQVAGLDLAAARYREARDGFDAVCSGRRYGIWQDQACALRDLADELERIRTEGEPYGTASFYRP